MNSSSSTQRKSCSSTCTSSPEWMNVTKRRRVEFNFWLEVPDDVLVHIIRFTLSDPQDLCGMEASCSNMYRAISRCWKTLAKDDYDLEDDTALGKDLWLEGRALASLHPLLCNYVYFRNADADVFRMGVFFGCNRNVMVMSSSDHNTPHQQGGGFIPPCPIRIRDAKTLKILANMDGTHHHKAVDLLGPSGNEIIIEYLDTGLKGYRSCNVVWEIFWTDPAPTDIWCLLPSEQAMLIVRNQSLHVFQVDINSNNNNNGLPKLTDTIILKEQVESPTMNWLEEGSVFCLHIQRGKLSFWTIQEGKLHQFRNMSLSVNKCFNFIYAGSKHYVTAGAQDDDGIYVFDTNGTFMHRMIENDVEKPNPQHVWSPMNACVVQGGLLVSNSLMGAVLCVWNLRTGQLVHRFEESIDQGHVFRPGNQFSDGTWAHCLDQLPSFDFPFFLLADNDGSLFAWAFPKQYHDFVQLQQVKLQAQIEGLR